MYRITLLILSTFLLFSCQKEIQTVDNISDSLMINDLLIVDGVFAFKDIEEFKAFKMDFYKKPAKYENYFIANRPIQNEFLKVEDFYKLAESLETEEEVMSLIEKRKITLGSNNEISYKYNFRYLNCILNHQGIVMIGDEVYLYGEESKIIFDSLSEYQKYLLGKETDPTIIPYSLNVNRATESHCTADQDFDAGALCKTRRIKGTIDIEWEAFTDDLEFCMVSYSVESNTYWYIRRLGIWWRKKADNLTCSINACIFNGRGSFVNVCCGDGQNSEDDVSRTTVFDDTGFVCFSPTGNGQTACGSAFNILLHGIRSADSFHTGVENSNCGTSMDVTITNCI